jgi:xanthine/uracil permease
MTRIAPEERLPWGQTIVSGLQHGVAMAGGTIIAPLIMGFDPNRALLFSGLGTLIFFAVVAGRVPSYLGSSFSFVAVVITASSYSGHGPNPNLDVALGGIIAAGVLYGIIALIGCWLGGTIDAARCDWRSRCSHWSQSCARGRQIRER